MRILHAVTRFLAAGSERNMLNWMRWEQAQGHEVHLAVGRDSQPSAVPEGIRVHEVPALVRSVHPVQDLRARRQMQRLFEGERFDVLHTHQSKAGVIGREAARGRVPVVVHTVHMASFGPGYSPAASAAFVAAERYCARFTDAIVCVGDELKVSYLGASIGTPGQYRVIHSPIEVDRFTAVRATSGPERHALRDHYGARPGARVAVAIGALEPRKRHELLIGELAPLIRTGDIDLVIAGDGPRRAELARIAGDLGCTEGVRLLGHVSDIPGLLGTADVLVHASTAEGVPQVVVQALAAGVPVVAAEVTGLREVPRAPVAVARRDGAGLTEAVRRTLREAPPPVDAAAFDPWRPAEVDGQIARLHREVVAPRLPVALRPGVR